MAPNDPQFFHPQNVNFEDRLNDMLAPLQQTAAQYSSPYATMRPDSWLAQNHPRAAGILDNAFLTAGMVPSPQGPEGVGGGISRTMQGLMGGQQYRREQMLRTAMLPYQMLQPRLQAMDVMSQTAQREAEVPYYLNRASSYEANWMKSQEAKLAGTAKVDDTGQEWQGSFDPRTGKTRYQNTGTQQFEDELPLEQRPSFSNLERQKRLAAGGGIEGELFHMLIAPKGSPEQIEGRRREGIWAGLEAQKAGAHTVGTETAPHPYTDTKTFIAEEEKVAMSSPKLKALSFHEWDDQELMTPGHFSNRSKGYSDYLDQTEMLRAQKRHNLVQWKDSNAPKQGVGFEEYMLNPERYDGSGTKNEGTAANMKDKVSQQVGQPARKGPTPNW
jgi:hypothetical protein